MRIAALGAVGIAGVLLVASFSLLAPEKASDQQDARNAPLPRPHSRGDDAPLNPRPYYPYSVVPGGVHSSAELASAVRDPVVAAHYGRVQIASARVETVRAPRRVHVSYRIGDRIYWTKRTVVLASGERLLTDGRIEIRTRCGNGISDTPQGPTSDDEPLLSEFDRAIVPHSPEDAPGGLERLPSMPPLLTLSDLADPVSGEDASFGGPTGTLTPANLAIGGSPARSSSGHNLAFPPDQTFAGPPSVPQPIPVPEPGSILLVATGLAGGAWRAWRRHRLDRARQR